MCVKKKVLFFVCANTSAPALVLSLFDQGDRAAQHAVVGWKRDAQLLCSTVSVPPCQGHGEVKRELGALLLLQQECHPRAERAVAPGAFCHPAYHSLRTSLGTDKVCCDRCKPAVKVRRKKKKKSLSALGNDHPGPSFSLETLAMPTAVLPPVPS